MEMTWPGIASPPPHPPTRGGEAIPCGEERP